MVEVLCQRMCLMAHIARVLHVCCTGEQYTLEHACVSIAREFVHFLVHSLVHFLVHFLVHYSRTFSYTFATTCDCYA